MNYATTSMLSSSSSDVLTGRLCGLMCSSVSVSLLCRLLTCVSRLDDRGAGVWSSIPSGHMHVQPVPEGRSCAMRWITGIFMSIATRLELKLSKAQGGLSAKAPQGFFRHVAHHVACVKLCAGNYLPCRDYAVRSFSSSAGGLVLENQRWQGSWRDLWLWSSLHTNCPGCPSARSGEV